MKKATHTADIVIGKRIGFGKESFTPHSLTMTMIGSSLLWVGWFGFNAGSAPEANCTATLAFVNTLNATAAAALSWTFAEWLLKGKPSMLGAASGAVAGLVAITPACGCVGVVGALLTGVFNTWKMGGTGIMDYINNVPTDINMMDQFIIQAEAIGTAIVWSAVVAVICYKVVDLTIGLRVSEEEEREGPDVASHGERAYNMENALS